MIDGNTVPQKSINIQLVNTLVKIIRSLSQEERQLLEKELFCDDVATAIRLVLRL